jgi:hypothetical protein
MRNRLGDDIRVCIALVAVCPRASEDLPPARADCMFPDLVFGAEASCGQDVRLVRRPRGTVCPPSPEATKYLLSC